MPDPSPIVREIAARGGVRVVEGPGAWYFYHDPKAELDLGKHHPFATVITSDAFDGASALDGRGAFRVNLGVLPETYRARFGELPAWNLQGGAVETGHDYRRDDVLLPHPHYAPMGWVCVVNPSEATWRSLRPLLDEAHEAARRRFARGKDPA